MFSITVSVKKIQYALQTVAKGIGAGIIPILSCVLVEVDKGEMKLTTTNYITTISTALPIEGTDSFRVAIPHALFLGIINFITEEKFPMQYDPVSQQVFVGFETHKNHIKCLSADEFKSIDSFKPKLSIPVSLQKLRESFQRVIFATSRQTSVSNLANIFISLSDKIQLTGTDSFRLSQDVINIETASFEPITIAVLANLLENILNILPNSNATLLFDDNRFAIQFDKTTIYFQISSASPIDISSFLSRAVLSTISLPTSLFAKNCDQLSLFADDKNNLDISVGDVLTTLRSVSAEKGQCEIFMASVCQGEPFDVMLNIDFVRQFLSVCKDPVVTIQFTGKNGPIFFKTTNQDFVYLIMPFAEK